MTTRIPAFSVTVLAILSLAFAALFSGQPEAAPTVHTAAADDSGWQSDDSGWQ